MKVESRMQFYVTKDAKGFGVSGNKEPEVYFVDAPPEWSGTEAEGCWSGGGAAISSAVCLHNFGFVPGYGECWWCVLSEDQQSWDYELVSVEGCDPE